MGDILAKWEGGCGWHTSHMGGIPVMWVAYQLRGLYAGLGSPRTPEFTRVTQPPSGKWPPLRFWTIATKFREKKMYG